MIRHISVFHKNKPCLTIPGLCPRLQGRFIDKPVLKAKETLAWLVGKVIKATVVVQVVMRGVAATALSRVGGAALLASTSSTCDV